MPCLKYIIQNANTPELRLLRGKTIECISLIGLAVGAEKFTTGMYNSTVWKFHEFSTTPILREINFLDCRSAKSAI